MVTALLIGCAHNVAKLDLSLAVIYAEAHDFNEAI